MPIFVLLFAVLLSLTACGDDSKSSTKPAEEDQELSSGGHANSSSSYKITSATSVVDKDAIDINDDNPSRGTVEDTLTGKTYKTLTLGIYTWIDENIVDKDMSVKSTCYAYDDKNCPVYGRLYMQKNASDMCPSGFKLPTVSDWEYRFERASDNPLVYGGVCYKRDTLECEGLKDSAMYLAYGDSAVLLTHSGKISGLCSADNGFYSLRCVKYRSIVYKMYELPDCDEDRSYNYPSVYVVDKDSSYSCYRGKWTDASRSHSCMAGEEGQKYLVNGVVYICKNGTWSMATIFDTDTECGKDNLYEEYVMNGVRYACSDSGMVTLTYPATELGYCSPKIEGKIADIDSATSYTCDNFRWRNSVIADYHGTCDSSKYGKVVTFKNNHYVCTQSQSWRTTTDIEDEIGPCTAALEDSIRATKDYYYYECDREKWYKVSKDRVLGKCTDAKEGDTIRFEGNENVCVSEDWNVLTPMIREIGLCTSKNEGAKGVYHDTTYFCKFKSGFGNYWIAATAEEELLGFCPRNGNSVVEKNDVYYKCYRGEWSKAEDEDVLKNCYSSEGERMVLSGREYVCDTTALKNNGAWYAVTRLDSALGDYCRTELLGKGVMYKDTAYVCRIDSSAKYKKIWKVSTIGDYMGVCDYTQIGKRAFNGLDTCVCARSQCERSTHHDTTYAYNGKLDSGICINLRHGIYWTAIIRDSIIDKRDSNVYGVVTLGTQKWLARNLHYKLSTAYDTEGSRIGTHVEDFLDEYEYYYVWEDAFGSNICPEGTHIPTKSEWQTLFKYAVSIAPKDGIRVLLDHTGWTECYGGEDLYGLRLKNGGFIDINLRPGTAKPSDRVHYADSYFWYSGDETTEKKGNVVHIDTTHKVTYERSALKEDAYHVRCILD